MLRRETAAGGAAYLHSLELLAASHPAADIIDYLPQSGPHGYLDKAGVLNVARQGENFCAGALFGTDAPVPLVTVHYNYGDVREGLHIVQHCGLAEKPLLNSSGGLYPGHAALALDGRRQRRALAADESARASVDMYLEIKAAAQDVLPQQPELLRLRYCRLEPLHRHGVLRAHIDIAFV